MVKFIDRARFIASSLSSLADNLAEEIRKLECKDCLFSWIWMCQGQFNKIKIHILQIEIHLWYQYTYYIVKKRC